VIFLDTHVLIWMASDPKRLSKKAREAIRHEREKDGREKGAREKTGVAIAAITLWELAWLAENGRIQVVGSVESFVRETASRVMVQPITPEIAAFAVELPSSFPKDPADRLIAATAMVEGAPLVTADERIRQAKLVQTIW
jgi:PIN domain nuclease of toxin-antitoxin system